MDRDLDINLADIFDFGDNNQPSADLKPQTQTQDETKTQGDSETSTEDTTDDLAEIIGNITKLLNESDQTSEKIVDKMNEVDATQSQLSEESSIEEYQKTVEELKTQFAELGQLMSEKDEETNMARIENQKLQKLVQQLQTQVEDNELNSIKSKSIIAAVDNNPDIGDFIKSYSSFKSGRQDMKQVLEDRLSGIVNEVFGINIKDIINEKKSMADQAASDSGSEYRNYSVPDQSNNLTGDDYPVLDL